MQCWSARKCFIITSSINPKFRSWNIMEIGRLGRETGVESRGLGEVARKTEPKGTVFLVSSERFPMGWLLL
jgi:hypothetical protein